MPTNDFGDHEAATREQLDRTRARAVVPALYETACNLARALDNDEMKDYARAAISKEFRACLSDIQVALLASIEGEEDAAARARRDREERLRLAAAKDTSRPE
jgi:hypothetical protein